MPWWWWWSGLIGNKAKLIHFSDSFGWLIGCEVRLTGSFDESAHIGYENLFCKFSFTKVLFNVDFGFNYTFIGSGG